MATRLICLQEYHHAPMGLHYRAGVVFWVADDNLAAWLMRDAPDAFKIFSEPPVKNIDAPPTDKMMRKPKAKK